MPQHRRKVALDRLQPGPPYPSRLTPRDLSGFSNADYASKIHDGEGVVVDILRVRSGDCALLRRRDSSVVHQWDGVWDGFAEAR